MKTLLSNYCWLIIGILYYPTVLGVAFLPLSQEELDLEKQLLQVAQQKIEDPYHQYIQAFIWLKQFKGNDLLPADIQSLKLKLATKLEQHFAQNVLFPSKYIPSSLLNTGIVCQIPHSKSLHFFWPGRLLFIAWYPIDIPQLELSAVPTDTELLVAAADYGYLAKELQLQYGNSTKKIRQCLQTLHKQGMVTHLHRKDAQSLLHLLLKDDPVTYQNFLEYEEKVVSQTKDYYLTQNSEQIYLLSTIVALTRPLNSLRDFFESWGCCPI